MRVKAAFLELEPNMIIRLGFILTWFLFAVGSAGCDSAANSSDARSASNGSTSSKVSPQTKGPERVANVVQQEEGSATAKSSRDQEAGFATGQASLTFKPPVLPIRFSLNTKGEPTVEFSPECASPLGTFGVDAGVSAVNDDNNMYLIFRSEKQESVFCVGTQGHVRLHTDGKHVIDISRHRSHKNTQIVDITSLKGTVTAEFVPDSSTEFLAAVPEQRPWTSAYLGKNGDFVSGPSNNLKANQFHMRIEKSKIQEIVFCEFGKSQYGIGSGILVVVGKSDEGKLVSAHFGIPKDSIMAARWLCYCHQHSINKAASVVLKVHEHNDICMLFDDGSIFNGIYYIPKSLINSIELDTSSSFGANIHIHCDKTFHWGKTTKLPFWSDASAKTFFEKMRVYHSNATGK